MCHSINVSSKSIIKFKMLTFTYVIPVWKLWLLSLKKYLNRISPRKSSKCNSKPAWLHIMKAIADMLGVLSQWDMSCLISPVSLGITFFPFSLFFWMIVTIIPSSNNLKKQRNTLVHGFLDSKSIMVGDIWGWGTSNSRVQRAMKIKSKRLVKLPITSDSFLPVMTYNPLRNLQPQKTAPVAGNSKL